MWTQREVGSADVLRESSSAERFASGTQWFTAISPAYRRLTPLNQPGHWPSSVAKECVRTCFVSISAYAHARRTTSVGPYHVDPTFVSPRCTSPYRSAIP